MCSPSETFFEPPKERERTRVLLEFTHDGFRHLNVVDTQQHSTTDSWAKVDTPLYNERNETESTQNHDDMVVNGLKKRWQGGSFKTVLEGYPDVVCLTETQC